MKRSLYILLLPVLFFWNIANSQQDGGYDWHDPSESITKFEGQGWDNIGYNRLPDKAEGKVRKIVWSLSKKSAGLGLRFKTDADSILITYQVDGTLAMTHMPTTGVSGIDLYVKGSSGWLWCRGGTKFKDTITYDFKINRLPVVNRTYQLYFPLYNNIRNLKIGVPSGNNTFQFLIARKEKPIVVYGTSIAQGACASRPGMAWTNILSRKLDRPVFNLGFSANGKLEPEVISLINEIDAAVFVLDCLPNLYLYASKERTNAEIQKRILKSVESIRNKYPSTPILLVQHAGYSDGIVDSGRRKIYRNLNLWMTESFENLKKERIKNIYLLTKDEIALSNDAFVDGTHPTDLGMEQYAKAYEGKLKSLLQKRD